MVDFTSCPTRKKAYGGANGNKICIIHNNENYMLKLPPKSTKKTELSYTNGCISEYISCHIYNIIGIPAQETILGIYKTKTKDKIVVACKDFTTIGVILQDFASLKNQVIDSASNGYGTELSDVLEAIDLQTSIDPLIVKQRFWDMFIMDALLGNFDRHNGNWGFLYDEQLDKMTLAPVYDCGSCLYPQADEEIMKKVLENTGEKHSRIFNFPTSALKQNDKKINYFNFLTSTMDENCLKSLIDIYPRIDFNKINHFISNIEQISDLQKNFYKTMLKERYDLILTPAYKKAIALNLESFKINESEEPDFE